MATVADVKVMRDLWSFFVHLRWHYQVFILSGGYLLGGLFQPTLEFAPFIVQFLNVHLLLNGGLTAFNSYFDEDEGPIGGLAAPPPMKPWMLPASVAVQGVGLVIAASEGAAFVALYVTTMALSVLYSAPPFRWKGRPLLSLVAVGVGTGTNTFLMGYLAAGDRPLGSMVVAASVGVAAMLLSLYPVSQVFQIEEDVARGDHTFASRFGLAGIRRFFVTAYPIGLGIAGWILSDVRPWAGVGLLLAGGTGGIVSFLTLRTLTGRSEEYGIVMRLKFGASMSFVLFLIACLSWV